MLVALESIITRQFLPSGSITALILTLVTLHLPAANPPPVPQQNLDTHHDSPNESSVWLWLGFALAASLLPLLLKHYTQFKIPTWAWEIMHQSAVCYLPDWSLCSNPADIYDVFIYLCIYIFMYLCIYVFMYLCIYVFMYLCIYVFMYLCIYVFMYLCIYVYIRLLTILCIPIFM